MEGSGLRSEGGMRSGLQDVDSLGFGISSTDFMPTETGAVSADVE